MLVSILATSHSDYAHTFTYSIIFSGSILIIANNINKTFGPITPKEAMAQVIG